MSQEGWKYIDATTFCTKVTDGTHDSPKSKEFGKPLITSKHIKGRNIDFDNAYFISEEDFHKINQRSKVDQWDVIISMIGEYCGFCYVERNAVIDYAVKNVGLFKTGNKIKADWLYYFLNSPEGKNSLASLKSGTSQPYLSLGALRSLPILIPESERKMERIVSILSVLDEKIELNRQTNATLEAIAQAIFKEWFVDFNFPGSTGEMVDSELGMMPRGWRVGKLGDICNITMGQSPPGESYNETGDGIPFYQGRTDFGFRFPTKRVFTIDPKRFAKQFDTLVSVRAPVGDMNIATENCCIGRGLAAVIEKNGNHSFTYYSLGKLTEKFKSFEDNGTVFGSINKTDFEKMPCIVPNDEAISAFENKCRSIDESIFNNDQESDTLATIRDTLLPKFMRGDIELQ